MDLESNKQARKQQEALRTQIERLSIENQLNELGTSVERTRRMRQIEMDCYRSELR